MHLHFIVGLFKHVYRLTLRIKLPLNILTDIASLQILLQLIFLLFCCVVTAILSPVSDISYCAKFSVTLYNWNLLRSLRYLVVLALALFGSWIFFFFHLELMAELEH